MHVSYCYPEVKANEGASEHDVYRGSSDVLQETRASLALMRRLGGSSPREPVLGKRIDIYILELRLWEFK